ncbi:serine/threonine protein kinase [Candidatus Uabimicrobium sp. HlEnr_7]|uniref:serine/threonine protein kinase n=1 Tax=Candidatus Uabimicrobium helgolandensis TaxID=3095367 RepID=UPI0035560113
MYKNENVAFGQAGIHNGILQERYFKEYIAECPEHSMMFSQWLLYKKYIDQDQVNIISSYTKQALNSPSISVHDLTTNNNSHTNHQKRTLQATNQTQSKNPDYIGRYKIISVLGQGGMGKVYKVFDPDMQKELALKVNFSREVSSQAAKRFRREAQTMSKLDHPGIVKAYDIGCENNQMFFTMDLVPGVSLKELQLSTPMSIKQSVDFIIKVCEIMDYAHRSGVVHRDLKPANIMVHKGKPIIMDFGLAKVEEASQKLSKTGMMMGTLRYMTPEQAEGRHSATTAQSDQYSIGAILYELLAKRPIFTAKTHLSLLKCILIKEPIPLCEINSKIPKELEQICNKALSKSKKHRYQSCSTMSNHLRKVHNKDTRNRATRRTSARLVTPKRKTISYKNIIIICTIAFITLLLFIGIGNKKLPKPRKNNKATALANQKAHSKKQSQNDKIKNKLQNKNQSTQLSKSEKNELQNKDRNTQIPKPKKSKSQNQSIQLVKPQEKIPHPKQDWSQAVVGFSIKNRKIVSHAGANLYKLIGEDRTWTVKRAPRKSLMVIPARVGGLQINFNLDRKYEALLVGISHLSTLAKTNYSPIDIYVNGRLTVKKLEPGRSRPHYYEFEIANRVKQGKNNILIRSSSDAITHHWLFSFGIFTEKQE